MNEHILYNNVIANLTKQLEKLEKEIKELKNENRKLRSKK
jgi:chaperonin cofactor prefoldin